MQINYLQVIFTVWTAFFQWITKKHSPKKKNKTNPGYGTCTAKTASAFYEEKM